MPCMIRPHRLSDFSYSGAAAIRRAIQPSADWPRAARAIPWRLKEAQMKRDLPELEGFDEDFALGGEVEYEEIEQSDESAEMESLERMVRAARLAGA